MNSYFKFPEPFTDGITSKVEIHVDWVDRLRVLFGGVIKVEVVILVEHTPGRTQSCASVHFTSVPKWLQGHLPDHEVAEQVAVEGEQPDYGPPDDWNTDGFDHENGGEDGYGNWIPADG